MMAHPLLPCTALALALIVASGDCIAANAMSDPSSATSTDQSMPGMTMPSSKAGIPDATSASSMTNANQANPMGGMDMQGDANQSMLLIDQLETFNDRYGTFQAWEAEAWYGDDFNKLWLRSEGTNEPGDKDADLEGFWSHAATSFWNMQLGVRQDFLANHQRTWAAFGLQGLAPYWLDLETTAYVSGAGNLALRLRTQYDLLFTQRLILQPELETNLYNHGSSGQSGPSGTSTVQLGLRLRYDINRQLAPYVGIVWTHDFSRPLMGLGLPLQPRVDTQVVIGIHAWL